MVDGNLEAPRILPFGEALTYAWFLLGLCAALSNQSQPVVSSILNEMDDRGVDPAKCHAEFESEAHGYVLTEQAWQRLEKLFQEKETWKVRQMLCLCLSHPFLELGSWTEKCRVAGRLAYPKEAQGRQQASGRHTCCLNLEHFRPARCVLHRASSPFRRLGHSNVDVTSSELLSALHVCTLAHSFFFACR